MKNHLSNFYDYLRFEKHLSKNSILSYKRDVGLLQKYFLALKLNNYDDISHEDIVDFLMVLHQKYSEASISRILSSLRSFFKFLIRENIVKKNLFSEISNPKKPIKILKTLNEEDVINFLDRIPYSSDLELRNKAMLEMLYSSGMRVSEIVDLKLNDIDYEQNYVRCTGKGNKERIVPIGKNAISFLKIYLKNSRLNIGKTEKLKSNPFIFLNKNGGKLTRQGFWKILKKLQKDLFTDKNIYPHLFRHSYATHMLERGADIRTVQELLGHSNISTTEIYTNINKKFIKESFFKHNPRGKIKKN